MFKGARGESLGGTRIGRKTPGQRRLGARTRNLKDQGDAIGSVKEVNGLVGGSGRGRKRDRYCDNRFGLRVALCADSLCSRVEWDLYLTRDKTGIE